MRAVWLVLALAACTKEGGDAPTSRDDVLARWKQAGLQASAFTAAPTDFGKDCATGTVDKLAVLVCGYATEKEAKAAEDKGLAWIGDATGVSRARGTTLIVVADRQKADPNGKTINKLVTLESK